MSNIPAAKRRRVEAANATLRRPFRSPVVKAPARGTAAAGTAEPKGDPKAALVGTPSRKRQPATRKAPGLSLLPETSSRSDEPTFVWASRREESEEKNAALEREIARLRDAGSENKESESRDELDDLIVKWRGAAQQAADELFEASRSRVESMGGMKELAAMRRRQAEFFNEEIGQGASRRPVSDEGSGNEEVEEEEEEGEKENEEYTMATMLRSLNIELDVIGYDVTEECWK